jgi:hypothetical protein
MKSNFVFDMKAEYVYALSVFARTYPDYDIDMNGGMFEKILQIYATPVFEKIIDAASHRGMNVEVDNDLIVGNDIARLVLLGFEVTIMPKATFIRWLDPEKYRATLAEEGWPALLWEGTLIPPPSDENIY